MARIIFSTGFVGGLEVREDAHTVRSAIHSALANDDRPHPVVTRTGPKLITVTPAADGNLPVYVNPAHVVMVKTGIGEASCISYDELKAITDSAPNGYPDQERLDDWWAERGVDHEGLARFCMEDAADSVTEVMPRLTAVGVPAEAVLAAGYAMSMEVGFILGWIAHERRR